MKLRNQMMSAWLPIAVAIISITATFVMWHALRNQERTQVERVVKLATYSIKADMVADMDIRIRGLVDMARLWQIWEKPRKDEFATRATLYISQVPGCVAIGWVDKSYALDWVVPVDGDVYIRRLIAANNESTRKALNSLLQTRGPLVMPTVQLSQDMRIVPVWAPVFTGDEFQGFILGIFRVQPLLDDITSDHADLGYEVVVSEGGNPIYTLSNTVPENEWAQEATVELPGNEWRLKIWPGTKALPDTQPLSRVVLLGGLLMSIQLTLTVFLAQKARLWAKHVDAANRELTDENAERRRAEEALDRLSGRLLTLQDEERRRIARELHDSTAQTLYGLSIKLKLLSRLDSSEKAQAEDALLESMEMADQCVREIRTMSYLLHPPSLDVLGLGPAVESLAKGFADRSGIVIDVEVPADLPRLPRDIETALFRIVQEGLSNVHRHSGSKTAQIRVSREPGNIMLVISDQGKGCPPEILERPSAPGLGVGIAGMRVRVRQLSGHLDIHSSRNGTEVIATLPLQTDVVLAERAMQV
jgi:signal transduction histidine kinase